MDHEIWNCIPRTGRASMFINCIRHANLTLTPFLFSYILVLFLSFGFPSYFLYFIYFSYRRCNVKERVREKTIFTDFAETRRAKFDVEYNE